MSIISQNPCAMAVGVDGGVREDNLSTCSPRVRLTSTSAGASFHHDTIQQGDTGMTTDTSSTEARGRTARTSRATLLATDRIPGALKAMVRR